MSKQLMKLAGDLQGVLQTASSHMSKLANQNAELLSVAEKQAHELMAYKLARRLEQRGLSSELDFESKVASLMATPVEKLASMEQAIELATGGFRLGAHQPDDKTASEGDETSSVDVLDAFIQSQAALT